MTFASVLLLLGRVRAAGRAATFKVSVASVVKWSQRFARPAARRPTGRRQSPLRAGFRARLVAKAARRAARRHLAALLAELAERGIKVSYYAVWHFFEHEGISLKKPVSVTQPTARGASGRPRLDVITCRWREREGRECQHHHWRARPSLLRLAMFAVFIVFKW